MQHHCCERAPTALGKINGSVRKKLSMPLKGKQPAQVFSYQPQCYRELLSWGRTKMSFSCLWTSLLLMLQGLAAALTSEMNQYTYKKYQKQNIFPMRGIKKRPITFQNIFWKVSHYWILKIYLFFFSLKMKCILNVILYIFRTVFLSRKRCWPWCAPNKGWQLTLTRRVFKAVWDPQNHRKAWVGGVLKNHWVPTPLLWVELPTTRPGCPGCTGGSLSCQFPTEKS